MFDFSILDCFDVKLVLIGADPQLARCVQSVVEHNCGSVNVQSTISQAISCSSIDDADWIMVDIDGLGGIMRIYDTLRNFRDTLPHIPVVLLSREFDRNEYGTHRLALGDVSLCVPFTAHSIEIGLLQAQVNNQNWQARTADQAVALRQKTGSPFPGLLANKPMPAVRSAPQAQVTRDAKPFKALDLTSAPAPRAEAGQLVTGRKWPGLQALLTLSRLSYWVQSRQ